MQVHTHPGGDARVDSQPYPRLSCQLSKPHLRMGVQMCQEAILKSFSFLRPGGAPGTQGHRTSAQQWRWDGWGTPGWVHLGRRGMGGSHLAGRRQKGWGCVRVAGVGARRLRPGFFVLSRSSVANKRGQEKPVNPLMLSTVSSMGSSKE